MQFFYVSLKIALHKTAFIIMYLHNAEISERIFWLEPTLILPARETEQHSSTGLCRVSYPPSPEGGGVISKLKWFTHKLGGKIKKGRKWVGERIKLNGTVYTSVIFDNCQYRKIMTAYGQSQRNDLNLFLCENTFFLASLKGGRKEINWRNSTPSPLNGDMSTKKSIF